MVTLLKLLLLAIVVSSVLISVFSFDLATVSMEVNTDFLNSILENRIVSGITGILLLGLVGQKMLSYERTS